MVAGISHPWEKRFVVTRFTELIIELLYEDTGDVCQETTIYGCVYSTVGGNAEAIAADLRVGCSFV